MKLPLRSDIKKLQNRQMDTYIGASNMNSIEPV